MALPDFSDLDPGTPVEWSTTGGKLITLTSLANNAAREGAKSDSLIDGTKGMPELLDVRFEGAVASAVTTGNEEELYFGESDSATAGTNNPGGLTGADAAYANPDEKKGMLNFVMGLPFSNTFGTAVHSKRGVYFPTQPHVIPVVVNKTGGALSGTAGNHKVVIIPWYRRIKD